MELALLQLLHTWGLNLRVLCKIGDCTAMAPNLMTASAPAAPLCLCWALAPV